MTTKYWTFLRQFIALTVALLLYPGLGLALGNVDKDPNYNKIIVLPASNAGGLSACIEWCWSAKAK